MIEALLTNAFFAGIAGIGFGAISNPPKKALLFAGMLSALGNTLRMFLMSGPAQLHIVLATFIAAFFIGLAGFAIGRASKVPAEVLSIPALLPMIPGMFAYTAVISTIEFLKSTDPDTSLSLLVQIFSNGMKAIFILCAIVIGASMSVFIDTLSTNRETRRFFNFKRRDGRGA